MWVKEKDDNGMIPLHNAYSQNLSNVINLLIDAYLEGADVVDKHGKKPSGQAQQKDQSADEASTTLLQSNAN